MDPNEGLTWGNLREPLSRILKMPQNSPFLNGRNHEDGTAQETIPILEAHVRFPPRGR